MSVYQIISIMQLKLVYNLIIIRMSRVYKFPFPTLIKYLRQKQKLIVNSRYKYDMRNIIMSLNNQSIDGIKQQFHLSENRIDLQKFLWLLKESTSSGGQDQYLVYYELVKLFEEIDIDNSNTIQWTQFLEYLSESAWISNPVFDSFSEKKESLNAFDKKVLFHAFKEDTKYRKNYIKKIVQIQRSNVLTLLTKNNQISFVNFHKNQLSNNQSDDQGDSHHSIQKKSAFTLHYIDPNKVLSIDYSQEQRLFGVLMVNRNLCFIEEGQMQKNQGIIRSSGTEIDIKFLSIHKLWALETVNSTLQLFPSPKTSNITKKFVFRPHNEPITAIKQISTPLAVCTSSLDGLIKLWQISTGKLIIELNANKQKGSSDQHKGVKGIATYNRGIVSYISSWMFTNQIFLWLPSLSLSKPYVGDLKGHVGLVLDCQFTWKGQLVSVDDKRIVKVWNTQKMECVQNFTIQQENSHLFILRSKPYLVLYSRLLDFYRMKTNSKADLQGQIHMAKKAIKNVLALGQGQTPQLVGVDFSNYYSFMIVVTSQQMKIIDVNTTKIIASIYPSLNEQQFMSMSMKSNRRIYLASNLGTIYQYKIEDGKIIKQINVADFSEKEEEELKFIYYHQSTKMLMVVIEKAGYSEIITYDQLSGDDSVRIKEIQFDQTNLIDFKYSQEQQKFFILSVEPIVTIWDYDKLIILNRIEIKSILQGYINVTRMIIEPYYSTLLLQAEDKVILLKFDQVATILNTNILEFHIEKHQTRTFFVTSALIKEKVPSSFLQEIKMRKTRRNLLNQKKKKVDFRMFDNDPNVSDFLSQNQTYQQIFILTLTDNFGQIFYYNLTDLLSTGSLYRADKPIMKGKLQRVKEKRKAHMKVFAISGRVSQYDYTGHLFNQDYTFIPKAISSGTVMGNYYFHTSDNVLFLISPYGQVKADWSLSINKPKIWNLAYNDVEQVLMRLQKTEKALQRIYQVNSHKFKMQFLITKYLNDEEVDELEHYQTRKKQEMKSIYTLSRKNIDSKKSIVSINDKIKQQDEVVGKSQTMILNNRFKNDGQDIFQKKLEEKEKRKMYHRKKQLYQKIQRSLTFSKNIPNSASQLPKMGVIQNTQSPLIVQQKNLSNNFVQQIQNFFNTATNMSESHLQLSKKQSNPRRASVGGLLNEQSKLPRRQVSTSNLKSRIKSSMTDLTKNFMQTKIQFQNFLHKAKQISGNLNVRQVKKTKIGKLKL